LGERATMVVCDLGDPVAVDALVGAAEAAAGAPLDASRLDDAGSVEAARATAPVPTFAVDAPGRSPPA